MIKDFHVSMVLLSVSIFVVRFYWMIVESSLLQAKLIKILPHVIDTLLLGSAILLAVRIEQYPVMDHWLTVKLAALIVYIILGSMALKHGKTKAIRISAGIAAILVFGFIVSVAVSKNPVGLIAVF